MKKKLWMKVHRLKLTQNPYSLAHCLKNVQMQSFFGPYFRKIRTRKNSAFEHFSRSGRNEGFDESFFSTSQRMLLPLAGISVKIQENGF